MLRRPGEGNLVGVDGQQQVGVIMVAVDGQGNFRRVRIGVSETGLQKNTVALYFTTSKPSLVSECFCLHDTARKDPRKITQPANAIQVIVST